MRPAFTSSGVKIQTFDEIFEELTTDYRSIYGQDINLDQDSPDGQRVAIEAKARLDIQTFGLYVVTMLDPDSSIGHAQNVILKYCGIHRKPATRSQVDVVVKTDYAVTLPKNFTVNDTLGQSWVTLHDIGIVSTESVITLFADGFGKVEAQPNTVTSLSTIILGVQSISNPMHATTGVDEESDEALRIRRNKSLENAAYSTIGGLYAKLANIKGVTDLVVYENDTKVDDIIRKIPANTIYCVIDGGGVSDIIESIVKNKTAGAGTKGDIVGTFIEQMRRPNGSAFPIIHTARFDRSTPVTLHVRLTARRKVINSPIDTALIKEMLSSISFNIGDSCLISSLYCDIYKAGDNFIAFDLEVSTNGVDFASNFIESKINEKFFINNDHIDINEIVQ